MAALPRLLESSAKYAGRNVLITGGLGFIGSSLAIQLLEGGARVTLVDCFLSDHGGNWYNIQPVRDHPALTVLTCDFADRAQMMKVLPGTDCLFHLAGQVSHILSLKNPLMDIEINIGKTAALLEMLRDLKDKPTIIYTGTRGQYGSQIKLPVDEDAPMNPKGLYELSNMTAEKMIKIYTDTHGIPSVLLRLTNIYGPRAQIRHSHFGVLNWFVRLAVEKKPITIMGNGLQQRDFLHIDDCVDAVLRAGLHEGIHDGQVFNVGVDHPSTFLEAAEILHELCGAEIKFIEFSKERAAAEPGNFYSDISKARKILNWEPKITLRDGLKTHYRWLKEQFRHYVM